MRLEGCVALITGANRHNGMGRAFVEALIEAGAKKVYAAARDPGQLAELVARHPGSVIPVGLDITDAGLIDEAAGQARDINLLINNAGIAKYAGLIAAESLLEARREMEVNYFGTLAMVRAFTPALKANGGGTIVNIASIASFVNIPMIGSYSASKAALQSLTQGVRAELARQFTRVIGVYPGPVETDMAANFQMPAVAPAQIARLVLAAIAEGTDDVFPDQMASKCRAKLLSDPKNVERQFAQMLPMS